MAEKLTVARRDGGVVCGATLSRASEEEAPEYARDEHGVDAQSPTVVRYPGSLVGKA